MIRSSLLNQRSSQDNLRLADLLSWRDPRRNVYGYISQYMMLAVPTAQACIALVSSQLAALPLQVRGPDGTLVPSPLWLRQPDPEMSRMDSLQQLVVSLLTDGNGFVFVASRSASGEPTALKVLSPEEVSVWRDGGETGRLRYAVQGTTVADSELVHIRGFVLPGEDLGCGPLRYASRTLGLATAEDDYAAARFADDGAGAAVPDGIIQSSSPLTRDQAAHVRELWQQGQGGVRRGPAILDNGLEYKPISMSSVELELVESRKWTAQQICTIMGVPSHLVGVSSQTTMTYYNVSQDWTNFVRIGLRAWGNRIEAGLQRLLPPDLALEFDYSDLLKPSQAERYQLHSTALRSGFKTVDEVREEEGLQPLEAHDMTGDDDA